MKPYKSYREGLLGRLKDPNEAAAYVNAALETGEPRDFLVAMRNVVEAQGNFSKIAKRAHLPRTHLYSILSEKGNPEFLTLERLMTVLGLRLSVIAAAA